MQHLIDRTTTFKYTSLYVQKPFNPNCRPIQETHTVQPNPVGEASSAVVKAHDALVCSYEYVIIRRVEHNVFVIPLLGLLVPFSKSVLSTCSWWKMDMDSVVTPLLLQTLNISMNSTGCSTFVR